MSQLVFIVGLTNFVVCIDIAFNELNQNHLLLFYSISSIVFDLSNYNSYLEH